MSIRNAIEHDVYRDVDRTRRIAALSHVLEPQERLRQLFVERFAPCAQSGDERRQVDVVPALPPQLATRDQLRLGKHGQVAHDGDARHLEVRRDVAGGARALAQAGQNCPSGRVGERLPDEMIAVHTCNINNYMFTQATSTIVLMKEGPSKACPKRLWCVGC